MKRRNNKRRMWKRKIPGVYRIDFGDYYYIGQSVDLGMRWTTHLDEMESGKHHSPEVAEMWKTNKNLPSFTILEKLDPGNYPTDKEMKAHLLKLEKFHMSQHSVNFSLNKDKKNFLK